MSRDTASVILGVAALMVVIPPSMAVMFTVADGRPLKTWHKAWMYAVTIACVALVCWASVVLVATS